MITQAADAHNAKDLAQWPGPSSLRLLRPVPDPLHRPRYYTPPSFAACSAVRRTVSSNSPSRSFLPTTSPTR